jgi:predicted ribonuclease YlaK
LYTGIKEVDLTDEQLAAFYENKYQIDMTKNQYLMIKRNGELVDKRRWDGEKFVKLKFKTIDNIRFGKIKPLNPEQECLFDLLENDSIPGKLIVGNWGSGKTFVTLCWSIDKIDKKSPYNKIIFIRNNVDVKDTVNLGALPAGINEKLKPWALPIADILGSEIEMDRLIADEKIELSHLGFIRSRSFDKSIVVVNECQNLTAEHMALLVSRIGNDSVLILDGDTRQIDRATFDKNNGIAAIVEALGGNEMFGMVALRKTERSKFAALAELISKID